MSYYLPIVDVETLSIDREFEEIERYEELLRSVQYAKDRGEKNHQVPIYLGYLTGCEKMYSQYPADWQKGLEKAEEGFFKKIWNFFKKILNSLIGFFSKLFGSGDSLDKAEQNLTKLDKVVEKVKSQIEKIKNNKEDTINVSITGDVGAEVSVYNHIVQDDNDTYMKISPILIDTLKDMTANIKEISNNAKEKIENNKDSDTKANIKLSENIKKFQEIDQKLYKFKSMYSRRNNKSISTQIIKNNKATFEMETLLDMGEKILVNHILEKMLNAIKMLKPARNQVTTLVQEINGIQKDYSASENKKQFVDGFKQLTMLLKSTNKTTRLYVSTPINIIKSVYHRFSVIEKQCRIELKEQSEDDKKNNATKNDPDTKAISA